MSDRMLEKRIDHNFVATPNKAWFFVRRPRYEYVHGNVYGAKADDATESQHGAEASDDDDAGLHLAT